MFGRIFATVALVGVLAGATACNGGDATVNRHVLIRLAKESTPPEQFTVTTHGRIVLLRGVVHSFAERERLERATREVDGVAGVENALVVDAPVGLTSGTYLTADPVDVLLRDEIRSRLDAQELDDIAVEVKDGHVTLLGIVPKDVHDAAMQIAIDATRTDENTSVEDRMKLPPP